MSKPRYNWWPYVLNMIRDYPIRKRDYDALHQQTITASTSTAPGGGGASTEQIALRQLPKAEQREYDAVHKAFGITKQLPDSENRFKVVELTIIKNRYSIGGAAMHLNISEDTAKRYRWEFIVTSAYTYGLLDKEEYMEVIKKRRRKKESHSKSQSNAV